MVLDMAQRNKPSRRNLIAGLLFVLASPLFIQPALAQESEIQWFKNLDEAVAAAQESNRPIMIDFWADWCAPCRVMDAEVYTNPALIAAFREKMIGLRVHFDLQPEMARKYGVPALPYFVFTNSNGTELLNHRGILEVEDLSALVKAFPADLSEVNRLDRVLQEDKDHFPALRDMGHELRQMGFYHSSSTFFEKALKHRDIRNDTAQREPILYSMALNSLAIQDANSAASAFERCLKEFSKSSRKPDFLLGLGQAYLLKDDQKKAKRSFDQLVQEFPDSKAAAAARGLLAKL